MNDNDPFLAALGCTAAAGMGLISLIFYAGGILMVFWVIIWVLGMIFGGHAQPQ